MIDYADVGFECVRRILQCSGGAAIIVKMDFIILWKSSFCLVSQHGMVSFPRSVWERGNEHNLAGYHQYLQYHIDRGSIADQNDLVK